MLDIAESTIEGERFNVVALSLLEGAIVVGGEYYFDPASVSEGVIHDIYKADGTMLNGVNDVNPRGMPIHSSVEFVGNGLVLTPIFPVESGVSVENVTRELVTDDAGNPVLRFFNPLLGRVIYLTG